MRRRVLHISAHALLHAIVFPLALVAAILLHIRIAPLRRAVVARVNQALVPAVKGKIVIDSVGELDLGGIDETNVRVLDPSGKLVGAAYGVRARIALVELLRSLPGTGPLVVHLTHVSARAVDLDSDVDESGMLGLQRALASPTPSSPGGRDTNVTIDRVDIAHVWAHGLPASGLRLDADVDGLHGRVIVAGPRLAIDAAPFSLVTRGMPLGANARGTAEAHLVEPAPGGGGLGAKVGWAGTIAGIAETIDASLDGEQIAATLDAPEVSPEAVRALWPASPIDSPATMHVDLRGSLPRLDLHVRATHDPATIDLAGPVVLGTGQSADLHVVARSVNIHNLISSAPATLLSASGDVTLTRSAAGDLGAKAAIDFEGGQVAGAAVPKGKIRASFSKDVKGMRADANVTANEPGAPTVLAIHLAPRGKSFELTFDGDTRVPALDAVPRLGPVARGRSELKTHGVVDFGKGEIDVKLAAEIHGLGHDVLSVEHASVNAQLRGSLASPQMDVTLHGDLLDFGGYRFSGAELEIHGPSSGADVHLSLDADGDGTPDLVATGELSIGSVTKIGQIQVQIARARETVAVHVGEVRLEHGEISVEPIEIDGLGGPIEASLHSSFGAARVVVRGEGIDLGRFERVSRVQEGLGCIAKVDVDVTLRREGADGHASLDLTKCTVLNVDGGSFGLEATFHGRKVAGRAHGELDDVASFELASPAIEVGGTGSLPESWKKAFGKVKFDGKVDVAKLAARLPRNSVPLDHVRGVISVQGRVQRDSPTDDTPGLNLSVTTAGLELVGSSSRTTGVDGTPTISPPAWRMDGIDLGVDARIDGDSGFAAVSTRLSDAKGELVVTDLKSGAVPYGAILDKPSRALSLLENVPFNVHVVFPSRDVDTLPPVLALKGIHGEVGGDITGTGTLLAPTIDLKAKVAKGRAEKGVRFPVDLDITAHYDGAHIDASVIGVKKGAQVMDARLAADARAADLLHGDVSKWTASGSAHLDALPLETITALNDRQVSGTVTGDVKLDGLHEDGRASFDLNVEVLKVGDVAYRTGLLKATLDGKQFEATMHLDQVDGTIDATAQAATKWGRALLPAIDPSRPPSGEVKAKAFRAALLLPFVNDTFTELDGRIDADIKVSVDPTTGRGRTQGTIAVSQGRFEVASIGGEFHDVAAKAVFTPDGVVKLEGVKASAMSGVVEAAATARLNGFALAAANATIQVPSSRPLLLTVQGAQVGTVEGKVNVAVKESGSAIDVRVDIPTFHMELPLTSSRDVQALGELEGVRIGVQKTGGAFVAERLDAPKETVEAPAGKTIVATIALGSDVLVKKGTQLSVGLSGSPVITIGDGVRANGQVRLLSGKIDVQGKSFDIDSGAVTFQGDPTDPQMSITASWTASDGTRVYAELRGTLKNPKVTLRSEPTYSQNEIIALLVYGSADATNPNAGAAAGVAGGAATQPLNRALENMGLGGVSTRVDTSAVTPRADVEVQIGRDLALQIAEVMGIPPPGTNPDVTLLTLSWRFAKAWSAQTTIGNAGTTILDLIWQYRY